MAGAHSALSPFPRYSRGERIADAVVHISGLSLAALALPWLLLQGFAHNGPAVRISLVLYGAGIVLMLGGSALYNFTTDPKRKEFLRRVDRASIFFMIAGTYSPLALANIPPPYGTTLLVFEWSLAIPGATLALAFPRRAEQWFTVLYLLMGWAILTAWQPLLASIGPNLLGAVLVGGLIYTVGVAFHSAERLRYHNALWHGCVLTAASVHYCAILMAVGLSDKYMVLN